jgi:DNA-binding response OmpR family regulator
MQEELAAAMAVILVVDDDETVALSIERILRREYQVQVAHSGADALKIARRIVPSLVVLDIIMPGMDGLEVCRELRRDPLLQSVPILFLTARGRVEDRIEGFEAGADDYLTKPFDLRELLLRVKAILRRSETVRTQPAARQGGCTTLVLGRLVLNCSNYQLSAPHKTVLLTPVEFDLVYHLMSHPGQVFSSERLLRELWDYPSDTGSPDLVRMHVRNLRLKIEPDSTCPRYILTVPRHGYTISEG